MADIPPGSSLDLQFDETQAPRVGSPPAVWPVVTGLIAALGLGVVVFLQLAANRTRIEEARLTDPAPNVATLSAEGVPPPPDLSVLAAPAPEPEPMSDAGPDPYAGEPVLLPPPPPEPAGPDPREMERLRAPALIVDLGEYRGVENSGTASGAPLDPRALVGALGASQSAMGAIAGSGGPGGLANQNADENFALRLGVGGDASKPAKASAMINLSTTVVEGSVIPAVLETAINSDLPGYVRAVVSRDVRSFDGSQVLVPRGSRLIGQYRSGVALGQSRAFVIWTRLIRPDGAAVDLASPATDGLGRGGLDGEVDRHFLQRFGGAILLSVLNLVVGAATDASDTSIVIASTRAGSDIASVALSKDLDIAPTVTVPQGAPVRVFVSQDLDFSDVGPVVPGPRAP
ncbi:MAG: type IV secretion system protein VirB10 [Alphaproteobacteria bacterium]|nr:type IV secretion system protein VirB10 [Alphaproteobacteria bacterium]